MVKAVVEARGVILRNGEDVASPNQAAAAAFDLLALSKVRGEEMSRDGLSSFSGAFDRFGTYWEHVMLFTSQEFNEGHLCYSK